MKFTSQVSTTREQSERLLALGLNTETADMGLIGDIPIILPTTWANADPMFDTPAWSLHRLIEMMPMLVNPIRNLFVSNKSVEYQTSEGRTTHVFAIENNIYDNVINCIEWLIIVDKFNKEYLEEK